MQKEFNTQGWCNPKVHFMADTTEKFNQVMRLIKKGKYFTINRPHQYGKTSMLELLTHQLINSNEWLVFHLSFQNISSEIYEDEERFCHTFIDFLSEQMIEWDNEDVAIFLKKEKKLIHSLTDLSASITRLVSKIDKKAVLIIDEVDSSTNNQLFMEFLGILRHKYLKRHRKTEKTFHSVILVGVHDIKTLKIKMTSGANITYNSPWNIAADFEVNMSFKTEEIIPMLEDYSAERQVQMDVVICAEKLVYYTSGYPFLVSAICKILDEKIMPNKTEKTWRIVDIDKAAYRLITDNRGNTNFDHLIKSLENNPELYQLVFDILIEKRYFDFNIHDPIINLGVLYGIFGYAAGNGLKIHNRIYSELILNYMVSKVKRQIDMDDYEDRRDYLLPDNQLDIERVLSRFQEFMEEQESEKDHTFLEKNGTLLFMAFLQPIINGKGYAFKEVQISNEKRVDVIITYFQHKYIIEMKIWRGPKKHEAGLKQLADYLKIQHVEEGYLLIFDFRSATKSREKKWVTIGGKRIFGVWV